MNITREKLVELSEKTTEKCVLVLKESGVLEYLMKTYSTQLLSRFLCQLTEEIVEETFKVLDIKVESEKKEKKVEKELDLSDFNDFLDFIKTLKNA